MSAIRETGYVTATVVWHSDGARVSYSLECSPVGTGSCEGSHGCECDCHDPRAEVWDDEPYPHRLAAMSAWHRRLWAGRLSPGELNDLRDSVLV